MKKKTNRREQKPKPIRGPRNEEFAMATISRHAAAARPIPSGKAYKRPKAGAKGKDW
jgi:hypothetical protein